MRPKRLGRSFERDLTVEEKDGAITEAKGRVDVMIGHEHDSSSVGEGTQAFGDVGSAERIDGGERLIANEDTWSRGEGA
jgi:hypothetical protein